MMREFKFIRGIYKDENVLSQDETKDTLFALYGDGSSILLDTKNDEDFQEKIVGLESDDREIYTVRPSQFSVKATKQNNGEYTVTYTLNEKTYDGSKAFPDKVKKAAENHLSENTTAHIPEKPSLILSDDSENATIVNFTFEDRTINKSLFFRVTGDMKEFTRTEAKGMGITAYKVIDNEVKYEDIKSGTFYRGRKQKLIEPERREIAPDSIGVNDENYKNLDVASSYTAEEGFKFVYNKSSLVDNILYNEPLNADLYKSIKDYLIEVKAGEALYINSNNNIRMLKTGYVAYSNDNCSQLKKCYKVDAYEFLADGCIDEYAPLPPSFNISEYRFFKRNQDEDELAYALVGSCVIQSIEDTIVESYEDSYSGLFVLESQSLRQLKKDDLIGKDNIKVYTEKKDSYNYPSFGGVYEDEDTAYYVTLSNEKSEDISKYNATTYDGVVAPKQDDNTFRQIENICITATES